MENKDADWLVEGLPTPQYIYHTRYGYYISWEINGFFGTPASKEFLLDVIGRFLLLFPDATRQPYAPMIKENAHINDHIKPYELKDLAKTLPSLPWTHDDTKVANWADVQRKKIEESTGDKFVSEDALFEATRHHLYRRAYAEGTTENIFDDYVQVLLETENEFLTHRKSTSDVRAKAKDMGRYMREVFVIREGYSDWNKEKRNEYMKEYLEKKRKEKGISTIEEKKKVMSQRIDSVLTDISLHPKIKTKSGKWKITAIANLCGVHRNTVSKYLKERASTPPTERASTPPSETSRASTPPTERASTPPSETSRASTPIEIEEEEKPSFSFAEYRRKKGRD